MEILQVELLVVMIFDRPYCPAHISAVLYGGLCTALSELGTELMALRHMQVQHLLRGSAQLHAAPDICSVLDIVP